MLDYCCFNIEKFEKIMKKFIKNFLSTIRFLLTIITAREFAFVYCVIGTIAQASHTFFLVENISSLDGFWKYFQAILLALFISSSLLYFTAIATDEESAESKKIHNTITLFTVIEILINIYYYTRSLIINHVDNGSNTYIFDYIFAILISCMIPVTIKLYSSHIRAKEWALDILEDKPIIENNVVDKSIDNSESIEVINIVDELQKQVSAEFHEENNTDKIIIENLEKHLVDIAEGNLDLVDDYNKELEEKIIKASDVIQVMNTRGESTEETNNISMMGIYVEPEIEKQVEITPELQSILESNNLSLETEINEIDMATLNEILAKHREDVLVEVTKENKKQFEKIQEELNTAKNLLKDATITAELLINESQGLQSKLPAIKEEINKHVKQTLAEEYKHIQVVQ